MKQEHRGDIRTANKQDAPGAISATDMEDLLHLGSLFDRPWHIVSCSALRDHGIVEGITWLAEQAAPARGSSPARARSQRSRYPSLFRSSSDERGSRGDGAAGKRRSEADESSTSESRRRARAERFAERTRATGEDAGSDDER